MSDSIRKTVLASVAILAIAALGVWWYSGFSLSFMKFFAAEVPQTITATFKPNPGDPAMTAADGAIFNQPCTNNWTSCRNAGVAWDLVPVARITVDNYINPQPDSNLYVISRALINFDTSSLPDDAVIISATVQANADSAGSGDTVGVVANTITSNTTYTKNDFSSFGTTSYSDVFTPAVGWNTWTLNTAGFAAINRSGVTKLGLRTEKDRAGTGAGAANSIFSFYSADYSASLAPTLTIIYTTGGATPTPTPTVTPTPSSVTGGSISCTPGTQTVAVGANAQLTAAGGSGSYTWLAPDSATPNASGATATFSYQTAGTKKVAVQSSRGDDSGSVDVVACTVIVQ